MGAGVASVVEFLSGGCIARLKSVAKSRPVENRDAIEKVRLGEDIGKYAKVKLAYEINKKKIWWL